MHLAFPIVWLPERATISLALKPCLEKEDMSWLRVEFGPGRLLLAALILAVVESLLPNRTFQLGPPSCNFVTNK